MSVFTLSSFWYLISTNTYFENNAKKIQKREGGTPIQQETNNKPKKPQSQIPTIPMEANIHILIPKKC